VLREEPGLGDEAAPDLTNGIRLDARPFLDTAQSIAQRLRVVDAIRFTCLSCESGPRDANFWRPSTRGFNLAIGTPFLFKLKAPHHAIAGYGFFAGLKTRWRTK
jgi:hypothetical protein